MPINHDFPMVRLMTCKRAMLTLLLALNGGCQEQDESIASPPVDAPLEPKKTVVPPKEFLGPIDPEWPPSRPEELRVELEASRLLDERLRAHPGERALSYPPTLENDSPGLYATRGKLGEFEYLDVVIGPMERPDTPLPLVVWFHGRGGKATLPPKKFRSRFPVRVLIPQAPDPIRDGYTWFATWTMAGKEQLLTRSIAARTDQVAALIEAFRRLRPTLGKPLLVGFSQGGMLSFSLATRYPNRFAAAFPMAGWLPRALAPTPTRQKKQYPYLYVQHGTADEIVPAEYGRKTVQRLQSLGLWVDFQQLPGVGHVVTPQMADNLLLALQRALEPYAGIRGRRKARSRAP